MSDRSDQMDREAMELMDTLDIPSLAADAKEIQIRDPMEDFKNGVMGFLKNRFASISRAEHIKELIFAQFENDIQGGRLTFDQMMSLLMRLDRDNNDSADSIISMFRPAGNGGGSLLTDIVRPGSDKSELTKAFENYTPEQLRKIDAVAKVIRDIVESGNVMEIPTEQNADNT
jgi:hypothetical protein